MARWANRELEQAIGGPIDETGLTEAALHGLIDAGVRENELLDFKRGAYEKGDPAKDEPQLAAHGGASWCAEQEFAKDVCALANHRGGLLLLGVRDRDGGAEGLEPLFGSAERHEQRLRQALLNQSAPLPDTLFLAIPFEAGGHVLAVIVPPSRRSPHAVLGGGDARRPLRYPVRHGSDTIWMTESEVAERYRGRVSGERSASAREGHLIASTLNTLNRSPGVWLFVATVPEFVLDAALDRNLVNETRDWLADNASRSPLGGSLGSDVGPPLPGPGRVAFTGHPETDGDDPTDPRREYIELFVDGSAFAAIENWYTSPTGTDGVLRAALEDDTIMLTELALKWTSGRVGLWGVATVIGGVHDTQSPDAGRPIALTRMTGGEVERCPRTRVVTEPIRITTVADLAVVATTQQRLSVAYSVLSGLLQHFGVVEPSRLRPDGSRT
jgi:hypothetical protein